MYCSIFFVGSTLPEENLEAEYGPDDDAVPYVSVVSRYRLENDTYIDILAGGHHCSASPLKIGISNLLWKFTNNENTETAWLDQQHQIFSMPDQYRIVCLSCATEFMHR